MPKLQPQTATLLTDGTTCWTNTGFQPPCRAQPPCCQLMQLRSLQPYLGTVRVHDYRKDRRDWQKQMFPFAILTIFL